MTARTPIPIARALGNPGKRRLKQEPPIRRLMPATEPWLDDVARAFLEKHKPILMRAGVVTEVDGPSLACLAASWSELLTWRELVLEKGLPVGASRRYVTYLHQAQDAYRRWAQEFGMTPLARTRLAQDEERDTDDARGLDF